MQVGHLSLNISARYLATVGGVPLGRDLFGNIESWWTLYPNCPGQKCH